MQAQEGTHPLYLAELPEGFQSTASSPWAVPESTLLAQPDNPGTRNTRKTEVEKTQVPFFTTIRLTFLHHFCSFYGYFLRVWELSILF